MKNSNFHHFLRKLQTRK